MRFVWLAVVSMVKRKDSGAGNGSRTRDLQLGKLTLYQLSYSRSVCEILYRRACRGRNIEAFLPLPAGRRRYESTTAGGTPALRQQSNHPFGHFESLQSP